MTTYLFIDGGHLRKCYRDSVRPWFGHDGEIDFNSLKGQENPSKLFYYDCLDDQRRDEESEEEYKTRVDNQEGWFNSISAIMGAHVRHGLLIGKGRNRRQKEVDILLAVDMMNHAVRKNMDRAVLLSGDSDFKPLVESLVQMGLFVRVVGDASHTSSELIRAADDSRLLGFNDYIHMSTSTIRDQHPVPTERQVAYHNDFFEGKLLELGILNQNAYTIVLHKPIQRLYTNT